MKREEVKFLCSEETSSIIKSKLKLFNNIQKYGVKSLYFDDIVDSAFYDKEEGINNRKKFRIRIYNNSDNEIYLEKKVKNAFLSKKFRTIISKEILELILKNQLRLNYINENDKLLLEFYSEVKLNSLQPKVIVSYERETYTDKNNKYRITFDKNINRNFKIEEFLRTKCFAENFLARYEIMEIKTNFILPNYLKEIIKNSEIRRIAYSKYYYSRSDRLGKKENEF